MTYAEFKASVRDRLPLDANREGAQTFIDKAIQAALLEVQRKCVHLRAGHESVYHASVCDVERSAAKALMPASGISVRAVAIVTMKDGLEESRQPLNNVPWDYRANMVYGLRNGYSISPYMKVFYFAPALTESQVLSMIWDGVIETFRDSDSSDLFAERVAQAVAYFVQAELARKSDNDLQLSASFNQSWAQALQSLFLESRCS